MGYNTKKRPGTELCLCSQCAKHFYESPRHRIFRTDPLQVTKDMCDHCRTRRGYNFIISTTTKSTIRHYEGAMSF